MTNSIKAVICRQWMVIASIITLFCFVGCAPGVFIGGIPKTYTATDSLALKESRPDVMDIAAETGKSMGMDAQKTRKDMLMLSSGGGTVGSQLATGFTGFVKSVNMSVVLLEKENRLDVNTVVTSNSGDPQEIAERLTSEFKTKLLERVR